MRSRLKFSFVILTWNRKGFLEKCISSLLQSIGETDDTEVVVMDNGSTDETSELLRGYQGKKLFKIVTNDQNYGLNAYKKLFNLANGEIVVTVDDDVIEFPPDIRGIFTEYFEAFKGFGFLALDVIQNEFTNGAKPPESEYAEIEADGKILQVGPTGGWCAAFRRKDYRKVRFIFARKNLGMNSPHDGNLSATMRKWLRLKSGIIKGRCCLHACGPYYSKKFGYLRHDIEKYKAAGLETFVETYSKFL